MKIVAISLAVVLVSFLGSSGSYAAWTLNGVSLTPQGEAGGSPMIVSDGVSGAIVVFEVCHEGYRLLAAQRFNSAGSVLWGAGGVFVCDQPGVADEAVVTDGGGARSSCGRTPAAARVISTCSG